MSQNLKKIIFVGVSLTILGLSLQASVSLKPYEVFRIPHMELSITNSMVTSWVISLLLIFLIRWAIGKPQLIPNKGQLVVENLIENFQSAIGPIVGEKMIKPTMPLLLGFFVFILIQNWSGLIPGVAAFGHIDKEGHFIYYFRPGNADLNMTLALAIVSFIAWGYFILRYAGLKALVYDLFGNKSSRNEVSLFLYYFLFLVFFGVGLIECISIAFRLISLSFRLFGNVFGGENLIASIQGIFGYLLPVPFYFLEALIGFIQAFVFTLLVAIYIGLICNHEAGESHT